MEENWIKCTYGCGQCKINVKDRRLIYVEPGYLIRWCHNVVDLVETKFYTLIGIPLEYYITCTYSAELHKTILPNDGGKYVYTTQFAHDLFRHVAQQISHVMIIYSTLRTEWIQSNRLNQVTLSLYELYSFRELANVQPFPSLIRHAITEIPIVTSNTRARILKPLRQRKRNKGFN